MADNPVKGEARMIRCDDLTGGVGVLRDSRRANQNDVPQCMDVSARLGIGGIGQIAGPGRRKRRDR